MGEYIYIVQQLLAGGLHSNHTVKPRPIWQILDVITNLGDASFEAPMSLTDVQIFLLRDKLLLDGSQELGLTALQGCQVMIATLNNGLTRFFEY